MNEPATESRPSEPLQVDGFTMPSSRHPCRPRLYGQGGVRIYFDLQQPNFWPMHKHSALQISIFSPATLCTASTVTSSGKTITQQLAGEKVCFIGSNQLHSCDWLQEAELINVYVEPDFLRQSVQSDLRGIVLGEFQTIARKDDQIRDVALRLRKHCLEFGSDDPLYFSLSGLSLAVRLLKVHLNGARYVTEPRGTLPIASRDRVIDYMRQHLGEKFDLMRLSAIAGFSPQHFVRLFKREFGVTPHDYVLDLRLLKAHQLLREGGRNVSEVAMATGFFDQSHLDRYFRRKFSCTPKSVMKGRP